MTSQSTYRRLAVVLAVVALLAMIVATIALPAAAAGQTGVRLVPETDQLSVGQTTTVEVVATNADGGVGAYNATVSLDDEYATITNASAGNARLKRIAVADDGSSAHLAVALLDTPDQGPVTIATITVEGTATGASDLSVRVHALGDEQGRNYQVAETEGVSLRVVDANDAQTPSPAPEMTESDDGTEDGTAAGASETDQTLETGEDGNAESDTPGVEPSQIGSSLPMMALVGVLVLVGAVLVGLIARRRL